MNYCFGDDDKQKIFQLWLKNFISNKKVNSSPKLFINKEESQKYANIQFKS